mmetsp:Transcript_14682/g.43899  ORF Transcript_14682/g.43899 Transcript_14682/m.43899 type:complete len:211 (+) Transcript_14682:1082-1714(+)
MKVAAWGLKQNSLAAGLKANLALLESEPGFARPASMEPCRWYMAPPGPPELSGAAPDGWLAEAPPAACSPCCFESVRELITSRDCWNSIFSPEPWAGLVFLVWDCLKFIQSLRVLSSSLGSAGSRFSALMRFISETIGGRMGECAVIIPRLVLCSIAKPSPVPELLSCCVRCSLVRATCETELAAGISARAVWRCGPEPLPPEEAPLPQP